MCRYFVFVVKSLLVFPHTSTYGRRYLTLNGNVRHALTTSGAVINTRCGGSYQVGHYSLRTSDADVPYAVLAIKADQRPDQDSVD
jgi:hypothetical protein